MTLYLKNIQIKNCGVGVSVPKGAPVHIDGLEIKNTQSAIEVRDPPGLLQALGLPHDTPPSYLIEALKLLEDSSSLPTEQRIEKLRDSRLIRWLGVGADLVSVGTVLLSAQAQGVVSSFVERILG